jgi:hypothetical protein
MTVNFSSCITSVRNGPANSIVPGGSIKTNSVLVVRLPRKLSLGRGMKIRRGEAEPVDWFTTGCSSTGFDGAATLTDFQ